MAPNGARDELQPLGRNMLKRDSPDAASIWETKTVFCSQLEMPGMFSKIEALLNDHLRSSRIHWSAWIGSPSGQGISLPGSEFQGLWSGAFKRR